ncbi:MAG TPA: glycosyl transferase, partial [Alphaproteobacteria bacterium]|nr:glycosyl transferase [Alphaproteobacteria bacterium]
IAVTNVDDDFIEKLKVKYTNFEVYITSPLDISRCINLNFKTELTENSTEKLYNKIPDNSAKQIMHNKQSKIVFTTACAFFLCFLFIPSFFVSFAWVINFFYTSAVISKLYFLATGYFNELKEKKWEKIVQLEKPPVYSLLIPLFRENEKTLRRLILSIAKLNYPKEKLDVKLVVEDDDIDTINNIIKLTPPNYFEVIKVPFSHPRTKPKACNYAINFCKGDYVTIYDAEDEPDINQLNKVLQIYNDDKENKIGAVQARLTYYNKYENYITSCFAIEYYSWFDMMLYGLHYNNFPIPLGGTSNHFRLSTLKSLYNWDPYNVTEDADLGVRIYFKGYKTKLMDSYTYEEATIGLEQWLKQRVRWIKGYMQTFIVYSRNFIPTIKKFGFKKYCGFFYFVGAPAVVFLTAPILAAYGLYHYFSSNILSQQLQLFSFINLLSSFVFHTILGVYIVIKNKWYKMFPFSLLFGFYWLLHCIAAPAALLQLILKPHHWNKTEHGKSKLV